MSSAEHHTDHVAFPSDRQQTQSPVTIRSLISVALVFLLSTGLAVWQFLQPYQWHEPHSVLSATLHPIEWNIDAGLPEITGNINAIAASANGNCLWIAGDQGLLAFSADNGTTWNPLSYDSKTGNFRGQSNESFPCAGASELASESGESDSTGVVYADASKKIPEKPSARGNSGNQAAPLATALATGSSQQNTKGTGTSFAAGCALPFSGILNPQIDNQCGIAGGSSDAAKQAESKVKNNFCAAMELPQSITYQDLIDLQTKSTNLPRNISDRSVLAQIGGKSGEGSYVTYIAYVRDAHYSDVAKGESVNCNIPGDTANDIHINLTADPADPDQCHSTTAEITPHYRPDSWTPENLVKAAAGHPVRLQGQLFYDGAHLPCSGNSRPNPLRASVWEIHPVYSLDICKFTTLAECQSSTDVADWIPLDSYPSPRFAASPWPPAEASALWGFQMAADDSSAVLIAPAAIYKTTDGGRLWTGSPKSFWSDKSLYFANHRPGKLPAQILGAAANTGFFRADGQEGWGVGNSGVIFHTTDGGQNWIPGSRAALRSSRRQDIANASLITGAYGRFIAPWYIFLLIGCGATIFMSIRLAKRQSDAVALEDQPVEALSPEEPAGAPTKQAKKVEHPSPPGVSGWTIGNHPVSDKPLEPGEPDALELGKIASGLSYFLSNEKTTPPLVIAVTGRWGSGKSSLMNLLKKQLESYGSHPVWFNAWHHQKEDELLAALLQAVKAQAVPPLFAFKGIGFRMRLLGQRLQRYWLWIAVIAAGWWLIHLAEMYLRNLKNPISIWGLISYVLHLPDNGSASGGDTGPFGPIAVITGVPALFNLLSRLLTAFGTDPASLLSSVAGTSSKKDLEAQTSFRQRFATEFREVTTSLAIDQRMLILIDDLDRCRPEKVREVLEAVNFLVSSGDCFVILGMARDVVEQYLSLSFSKVVDSISWDALGLGPEEIDRAIAEMRARPPLIGDRGRLQNQPSGDSEDEAAINIELAAKRRAYSRLYLEKLIQIEVTIPEPTPLQKRVLFESEDRQRSAGAEKEKKLRKRLSLLRKCAAVAVPLVQGAVICAAIIGAGYFTRDWFKTQVAAIQSDRDKTKPDPQVDALKDIASRLGTNSQSNVADKSPQAAPDVSNDNAGPRASQPAAKTVAQQGPQKPPAAGRSPEIQNGSFSRQSGWLGAWPFALLVLLWLAAFSVLLQQMPKRDVHDSQVFTNALNVWYPLVMTSGAKNTPRTAKRFQNRVRYLAMRQRAMQQPQLFPLGVRWLRRQYGLNDEPIGKPVSLTRTLSEAEQQEVAQLRGFLKNGVEGETSAWMVRVREDGTFLEPRNRQSNNLEPKESSASVSQTSQLPSREADPSGSNDVTVKKALNKSEQEFEARVLGNVFVPEPLLVAFAAIEEYDSEWIRQDGLFESIVIRNDRESPSTIQQDNFDSSSKKLKGTESKLKLLRQAQEQFEWFRWNNLVDYRFAYLRLCSEITRDDAREPGREPGGKQYMQAAAGGSPGL